MAGSPLAFYTSQIDTFQEQLKSIRQKLFASSMLRLAVFLILIAGVYYFFGNARLVIGTILTGVILFVFLVSRHSDLSFRKKLLQELIAINKKEIQALRREVYDFPEGMEFETGSHYFSQDIDLFGRGSFYQYLNRTATMEGAKKLSEKLKSNDIQDIDKKQEAVKELSDKAAWRQDFSAYASVVKSETPASLISRTLREHKFFTPGWAHTASTIFSFLSLAVLTAFFLDFISGIQLLLWFFIGLGITGFYVKKVNKLSSESSRIQEVFQQYHHLLLQIEKTDFSSVMLQEFQEIVQMEKEKASAIVKRFSKNLDALDQRNNMLLGVFLNGFLLWDLRQSHSIEKWISRYGEKAGEWFDVIAEFDAQNSLANFTFNHSTYTFPEITSDNTVIEASDFTHPLLDPGKAVANDFRIEDQQFFIITGANMAGKSTFLRTVSLGIVMANVGLPVCASSFRYAPIKLITSMRTTDSLTEDESYFFSELKRLKFVVDQIEKEKYFIILDEILKGTNSTDKALGSRKFIQKLVASHSTGIIATHDLSLCEVAEELPAVKNHYFDAEIISDELHFDYTIKKGVAQNMNASFLLKKMKIVD